MDPYIYKLGNTYLVFPPVFVADGGGKVKFINTTDDIVRVILPEKARHEDEPEFRDINPGKKQNIRTKDQGGDTAKAYQYKIIKKPAKNKKILQHFKQGGSDPILILEN